VIASADDAERRIDFHPACRFAVAEIDYLDRGVSPAAASCPVFVLAFGAYGDSLRIIVNRTGLRELEWTLLIAG
jgi:hypothetical protein